MAKEPLPISVRIKRNIIIDDNGCWLWQGNLVHNGYGIFRYAGTRKRVVAHRASYIEFVGAIPDDLVLDHLCKVRHCVNPLHLEPVTSRENTMRSNNIAALNAHKTHCKNGHLLTGNNLFLQTNGSRRCRQCHNKLSLVAYHKRKVILNAV